MWRGQLPLKREDNINSMISFSKMLLSPGVYTETKEPKSHNRKQKAMSV